MLFIFCVSGFILTYVYSAAVGANLKMFVMELTNNKGLAGFVVECLKLTVGLFVAFTIATLLTKTRLVDSSTLQGLYLNPVRDFFQRYGIHSAILLLAFGRTLSNFGYRLRGCSQCVLP